MKVSYFCSPDAHPQEQLPQLVETFKSKIVDDGFDEPADGVTKTSRVGVMQYGELKNDLDRIVNIVFDVNKWNFGFDLYQPNSFSTLLYNEYDAYYKGEYSWHGDGVLKEQYDIKLTALLNCSDTEYEGGKFKLFINGEWDIDEFDKPGSLLIFPSWIQHKVTPVTAGVRKSMALFFTGPNLR
jgi:PKHD-type hydroxylase